MTRSLVGPLRIAVPALIVIAGATAYLTSETDDVTALETDARQPSTAVAAGGESDRLDDGPIVRSPSTLRINGLPAPSTAPAITTENSNRPAAGSESRSTVATTAISGSTTTRPTTTAPPLTTAASTTAPPTTTRPTTASTTASTAGPCSGDGRFERVFRDDFDGTAISSNWRQYHSIGNNDFGLRRPSANTVSNGRLFITAQMIDGNLVSGGMAHNYDQLYGKYVVKVRTDQDPDLATSGVVLTWPESQVHPRDGENNIYESLKYDTDRSPFYTVIHKPFGTHSDQVVRVHNADGTEFQVMTMEWTPEAITIIREGPGFAGDVERWTLDETSEDLIPDVPHHVTIQLDAWKQSMSTVVRMEVDYIEVHRYCG
ncbi:MAG: glycoside hydrolase family 16 protein [Acidimicrobiales bacterium]